MAPQAQQEADDPVQGGRQEPVADQVVDAVGAEQEAGEEAPDGQQDQEDAEAPEAERKADGDGQCPQEQPLQCDIHVHSLPLVTRATTACRLPIA